MRQIDNIILNAIQEVKTINNENPVYENINDVDIDELRDGSNIAIDNSETTEIYKKINGSLLFIHKVR